MQYYDKKIQIFSIKKKFFELNIFELIFYGSTIIIC